MLTPKCKWNFVRMTIKMCSLLCKQIIKYKVKHASCDGKIKLNTFNVRYHFIVLQMYGNTSFCLFYSKIM